MASWGGAPRGGGQAVVGGAVLVRPTGHSTVTEHDGARSGPSQIGPKGGNVGRGRKGGGGPAWEGTGFWPRVEEEGEMM